jgi:hypothetical protein
LISIVPEAARVRIARRIDCLSARRLERSYSRVMSMPIDRAAQALGFALAVLFATVTPAAGASPMRTLIATPPDLAGGVHFASNGGDVAPRPINPGLRPNFEAGYRRNFVACPGGGACRGMQVLVYRYSSAKTAQHALDVVTDKDSLSFATGYGVGRAAGPFQITGGDPQGRACYYGSAVRGRYYVDALVCRNDVDVDVGLRGLVIQTVKLTVKRVIARG